MRLGAFATYGGSKGETKPSDASEFFAYAPPKFGWPLVMDQRENTSRGGNPKGS